MKTYSVFKSIKRHIEFSMELPKLENGTEVEFDFEVPDFSDPKSERHKIKGLYQITHCKLKYVPEGLVQYIEWSRKS